MIINDFIFFFMAFIVMWIASELIINGIDRLCKKIELSSFMGSFFILGLLTCGPELAIGVKSLLYKKPEIFVGDLIGSSMVLFLLVIPLLAILGKSITFSHYLSEKNLLFSLLVVITPLMFTLDGVIYRKGAIFMMILYILLFYFIHKGNQMVVKMKSIFLRWDRTTITYWIMILSGVILISIASKILVERTVSIADYWHISPYLISLLVLSVGTNLPELFIAVRSVTTNRKEIALGDYVGSAVTNTLLFGIFTLFNGPVQIQGGQFLLTFCLFFIGLIFFFFFSRSNNELSRREGFVLIGIYCLFIVLEIAF